MEREFMDWSDAPLPKAADWLLEELGHNLGDVLVALPGARSGRILGELLARRAGPSLIPPRIVTAGLLSDELLQLEGASASRLVRTLAWERSLRELAPSALMKIVARPPSADDQAGWVTLAEEVRGLFGQVAAEGLDFGMVAKSSLLRDLDPEQKRWEVLKEVQDQMANHLHAAGLRDPHLARLSAIEAGAARPTGPVVLIGVVEMNTLLRRSLEICQAPKSALIFAPPTEANGFDDFGCLIPDQWKNRETGLRFEDWHVVDRPADQALETAHILSTWGTEIRAEQVTIGLADPEVSPYLTSRLAEAGLRARDAAGTPISRTPAVRLLGAVSEFLRSRTFVSFSALVRHHDFESALLRLPIGCEPIDTLDEYHAKHLPWHADGNWPRELRNNRDQKLAASMEELWQGSMRFLGKLDAKRILPLGQHSETLRSLLQVIYGNRDLDPRNSDERVLIASLRCLAGALSELSLVPLNLTSDGVLPDAIDLLLRLVTNKANDLPPLAAKEGEATIEMMGWLELPLDDAPALVVTGFEDGKVPESVRGDAFLPNRLRRDLGLIDNAQRLARDLYATELLVHSRERIAFVSGRRNLSGDPQVPSRVVFHCGDDQIPLRVRRFLGGQASNTKAIHSDTNIDQSLARLAPRPKPDLITVSAFKSFLDSPYDYYLKHVLKLKSLDDRAREMDGSIFGNLAHGVLQRFGQDTEARDSHDPKKIETFLMGALEELGREIFGQRPLPAVQIQLEQLALRLKRFSLHQSERRAQGWCIHAVEWAPKRGTVDFPVDNQTIQIKGRIDRIDRHETRGDWAIWDYKTGSTIDVPLKAHRRQDGSWRDLQLPLYTLLAVELLGDAAPTELGYIALGKDESNTGFWKCDDWRKPKGEFASTEEALDSAFDVAKDVVRRIRNGDFFDTEGWKPFEEIFQAIGGVGLVATSGDRDSDAGDDQ